MPKKPNPFAKKTAAPSPEMADAAPKMAPPFKGKKKPPAKKAPPPTGLRAGLKGTSY